MSDSAIAMHEAFESYLLEQCNNWYADVRKLLPDLPENITISLDNGWIIPGSPSGGYTPDQSHIVVAYDPFFKASVEHKQMAFKASLYHEAFHLAQDFCGEQRTAPPMTEAINEGAATVFEMLRTGSRPGWGNYPANIKDWLTEVLQLPIDYDRTKWKFYDSERDRHWILYRVGTFIVSTALQNNAHLSIEKLASMKPAEILELSGL